MKFKLYQIKKQLVSTGTYLFMSYDFAKNHGFDIRDYEVVYEGEVEKGRYIEDTLENIFVKFNINRPEDFKGHSLSVSDIVQINGHFYYVDNFGFKVIDSHIDYDLL